jgi:hypothetical protein
MSRLPTQPAEQIQQAAAKAAPAAPGAPEPEPRPFSLIPLRWRIVFLVWTACFSLVVSVELLSHIVKFFDWLRK